MSETTRYAFVMVKPDAVAANATGTILAEFEAAGFKLHRIGSMKLNEHQVALIYKEHISSPHFERHAKFMLSGPVVAMVLKTDTHGEDTWKEIKKRCGATDPKAADKATIRGRFGTELPKNAIHSSDSERHSMAEACVVFKELWK